MSEEGSPTIAALLWGDAELSAVPEVDATTDGDAKSVIAEHGRKIAKCEEAIGEHEAMLGEHAKVLTAPPKPAPVQGAAPVAVARPDFSTYM